MLNAAAKRAGLDSDAIAACAATQATKDAVNADIKLAEDVGVDQTPMIAVNGRVMPFAGLPYDVLKQVIQFQATLDGASSQALPPQPWLPSPRCPHSPTCPSNFFESPAPR